MRARLLSDVPEDKYNQLLIVDSVTIERKLSRIAIYASSYINKQILHYFVTAHIPCFYSSVISPCNKTVQCNCHNLPKRYNITQTSNNFSTYYFYGFTAGNLWTKIFDRMKCSEQFRT
ncbi:unnamed protein product [Parnassius mnemosyne]|uniref:Uncharacterized protein n=1 Tax=Parnassius mnemosyne TaxID=213953 RepID=A0AAV1L1E9_9NEOP